MRALGSDNKLKDLLRWLAVVAVSLVLLLAAHVLFASGLTLFDTEGAYACKAEVLQLGELESDSYELGEDVSSLENYTQYFTAQILNGEFKGETVIAAQTSDNYTIGVKEKSVEAGDKVVLYNYGMAQGDAYWVFGGYARFDGILLLIFLYCAAMLLLGRLKGFKTLVSLALTCIAVFYVFIPATLNGHNMYLQTALVCIYTIVMTLLITAGFSDKSLTTIIGCSFGVAVAAVLAFSFDKLLLLTGMTDEHSVYLIQLNPEHPMDLNALIFAMIVIGALGAVMDVAMDISLHELHVKAPHLRFPELFRSGITIGRDIMGTMANTLVLAYIGSQLCTILLLIMYSSSLYELVNREGIVVEMLNAFIGSLAILLTIPLTSLVCAAFYTRGGVSLHEKNDAVSETRRISRKEQQAEKEQSEDDWIRALEKLKKEAESDSGNS